MPAAIVRTLLGSLLLLSCVESAAQPRPLQSKQRSRARVAERVLALAFVGENRVLSLAAGSVSLWRLDDGALQVAARSTWPLPPAPVRHGGGLLVGIPDEKAVWLVSSYLDGAQLVRVDGARLVLGETAGAAPWPAAPNGLRFRPGTNLVDGIETGEGDIAAVALDPASQAVVRDDGMLLLGGAAVGVRIGGAVASLWPDVLLGSAPDAPALSDSLRVLRREAGAWVEWSSIPLLGSVSAVAARAERDKADVVVALDTPTGPELVRLELRQAP